MKHDKIFMTLFVGLIAVAVIIRLIQDHYGH